MIDAILDTALVFPHAIIDAALHFPHAIIHTALHLPHAIINTALHLPHAIIQSLHCSGVNLDLTKDSELSPNDLLPNAPFYSTIDG
jgi:hypothetical protein